MQLVTAVAVIAGLYFGREVVIPFALAVLLSFLLTYPVRWLESLKLGRAASVVIVLSITFSAGSALIWTGTQQLAGIIIELPKYQDNIQRKLQAMRNPAGSGLAKIAESINQITRDLSLGVPAPRQQTAPSSAEPRGRRGNQPPQPAPAQIVQPEPGMFEPLGLIGSSLASALLMAGAVVVLTFFMLLRHSDLRNRLFRLFGKGRINLMTTAMDDAAQRVSRYLLTQSCVNGAYGLLLGLGLWGIGVPFAVFWGFIAAFLRFIPYIGTLIAGGCPFLLSLAVFDGWKKPLLALALFAAVELGISGLVEPVLYATRTGISSLAILLSAAFWTMLWGPIGLLLSTPLTVLLLVIGRHVSNLEFLYILLGDEPVLAPEAHYYQRLLADDEDEARDVIDEYLEHGSLLQLYDSVLIPALALAEQDRHNDQLDEPRRRFIYQSTRELVEELGERPVSDDERETSQEAVSHPPILCVPARDEADELTAAMLVQVLRRAGYAVESAALGYLEDMLAKIEHCRPEVLIISVLPPFSITHARSLCRRARQRCSGIKVVIGLWTSDADREISSQRLGQECSQYIVHTLADARLQMRLFSGESVEAPEASG